MKKTIAISRTLGAGGEEVGRLVAGLVGYRYIDDEIIEQAAASAGVTPEAMGRIEHTPSLIERIVEAMGTAAAPEAGIWIDPATIPLPTPEFTRLIEQVIRQTAEKGDVVILAHGASIALAGVEGVLRVLVTASPPVRAKRLAEQASVNDAKASKAVEDSDRQRREYFRRFYKLHEELPTHYDLVINTDVLKASEAAELLVVAAKS